MILRTTLARWLVPLELRASMEVKVPLVAPGPKGDLKNCSFLPQVNNVSIMTGPTGPRGFNGSQGPAGPAGSIGAPGLKGAGDFSACQYKIVTETETPGDPTVMAAVAEPNVSMLFTSLLDSSSIAAGIGKT